jgi:hypothetical protein
MSSSSTQFVARLLLSLQLPGDGLDGLSHVLALRRYNSGCVLEGVWQDTGRDLLDGLAGGLLDVDVLAIDVVPSATDEEVDVMWEVEDRGDKEQTEEEEDNGVW